MKKYIIFIVFLFSFFIAFQTQSTNIGTIKLDFILNKTNSYIEFINELDKYKKSIEEKIKIKENSLISENKEIENSSLILNEEEINELIIIYQEKVSKFQNEINEYNLNISENIEKNKNIVIKRIAEISRNIAIKDNIHIILNDNSYFLSSEDIDISKKVINLINLENIELSIDK